MTSSECFAKMITSASAVLRNYCVENKVSCLPGVTSLHHTELNLKEVEETAVQPATVIMLLHFYLTVRHETQANNTVLHKKTSMN